MARPAQVSTDMVVRARDRLRLLRAPDSTSARWWIFATLVVVTVAAEIVNVAFGAAAVPALSLAVPAVLGGLLLPPIPLAVLLLLDATALVTESLGIGSSPLRPGTLVVLGVVGAIALELSRDRERLGLSAEQGENMLVELRDRLLRQGAPPDLGTQWHYELEQSSAGGASFGGDFVVSAVRDGILQVVVVDVSGKGIEAGSRALLLSGAMGGLLGAVAAEDFLPRANDFLLDLDWDEGFATALHLWVDLASGAFRLANAGHLPAVHHRGGSGQWELLESDGMVLGLLPSAGFGAQAGVLQHGDALVLYTDGLVEIPGRSLALGIDRMLGAAERAIARGFDDGPARIMSETAPTADDDRTLLMIWRT